MNNDIDDIKVSVCVVTYNQGDYIGECLESIITQDVDFPIEIIVADDCSTDNTREVINTLECRYPNIIRKIYHNENIGPYENYKSAHHAARGEYVAHCDGDDFWYPKKLRKQVNVLDSDIDVVQCWTFANVVDDFGNVKKLFPSRFAKTLYPNVISAEDIVSAYALVGQHSTQLYRKSARKHNDEESFLDYWIAFNLSVSGKSIYLKEILSAYRVTSQPSLTRNKNPRKPAVDYLSLHLYTIAKKYPDYAERAKANILVRLLFSKIVGHNTDVLNKHLKELDKSSVNYVFLLKSSYWFLIQKLL